MTRFSSLTVCSSSTRVEATSFLIVAMSAVTSLILAVVGFVPGLALASVLFEVTTYYAHLSAFEVIAGQEIRRGDLVGKSGGTGRTTGPHLHYEVRILNTPVNPSKYLRFTYAQQVASGAM